MDVRLLCSGPGRLCQALGALGALDGRPLDEPPFTLDGRPSTGEIAKGRRVGITRGVDKPWPFGLARSPFLSRPLHVASVRG